MFPVGDRDLGRFLHEMGEDTSVTRKIEKIWLRQWFSCLISDLAYIHTKGVRHQDIKPSNIVHRGDLIFFTDFNSAAQCEPGCTTSTENPARKSAMYSAPEVLDRLRDDHSLTRHGTGTDIFSLGCAFYRYATCNRRSLCRLS
ncbi:hypothetical protein K469DRAFT_95219 [Zopfia rhizophila CBS 207.26]|uniref:Protein kinase domain-containing protein n=1 Tax=Zopfia rhizophila CBS 207.26 TaxID=1314779 RepID=A0A6A6E8V3_9PEZI|nr:hypothetical protein K469DRAFT_95219 [Zopfia rhizophila CBS 207.26]